MSSGGSNAIYWFDGDLVVTNCILWSHPSDDLRPQIGIRATQPSTPFISHSNVQGLAALMARRAAWIGPGMIDADPMFVDRSGPDGDIATWEDNDYRLLPGSPGADRGADTAVGVGTVDLAGQPRIQFCHVDMGAYETSAFADCNANDSPDGCDIVDGLETDCDGDFTPDSCQSDLDDDSVIDVCDNCRELSNPDQADSDQDGVGDSCDHCPDTISTAVADGLGCPPVVVGDFNRDGDVDDADLHHLQLCMTGPNSGPPPAGCIDADLDGDGDVDQSDFGTLQPCLSGADLPAKSGCE